MEVGQTIQKTEGQTQIYKTLSSCSTYDPRCATLVTPRLYAINAKKTGLDYDKRNTSTGLHALINSYPLDIFL